MLSLGLSAQTLAAGPSSHAVPADGWTAAALVQGLNAVRAAPDPPAKDAHLRLLLCSDLCKHFVQQPAAGVRSLAELQTLAALRAAQLFGGPPQAWAVVADWQLTQPMVCAALPAGLIQALLQALSRPAGQALALESAALAALERLSRLPLPSAAAFVAWVSPAHLMLARLSAGAVHGLQCLRRPPEAGPTVLADSALREAQQALLREAAPPHASSGPLVFAWPGAAPVDMAPRLSGLDLRWFDASAALPPPKPAESEAAWASRLAALS
jgi:hypothetical protein